MGTTGSSKLVPYLACDTAFEVGQILSWSIVTLELCYVRASIKTYKILLDWPLALAIIFTR